MKRIVTDNPRDGIENALNLFYAKDRDTWVRGYGEKGTDINLCDLIRQAIKAHNIDFDAAASDRDIDSAAYDWLGEGVESAEGVIGLLHCAAWVAAELRANLGRYEEDSHNAVIIKHTYDGGKFLFAVPYNVDLKKGDKVLVQTRKGEQAGFCYCDSFRVNNKALEVIAEATGAKFPLANVIGRYDLVRYGIDE